MSAFVDVRQVRRNFRRVASGYAEADFLACEVDGRMLERLEYVRLEPEWIVDLGCGPGRSLQQLQQRYSDARCMGVDTEAGMFPAQQQSSPGWRRWLGKQAAQPLYIQGNVEHLPLAAGKVDLLWSNLLLHWLEEPRPLFREALRTLKVGGLLMFSTFGPDTLKELRGAFADGHIHTQRFTDMHDIGDMLVESGFADPVMDMEVLTLTYEHLEGLIADLRNTGASCAMTARRRGLGSKEARQTLYRNYEKLRHEGRLPATFEVIYGHAWKAQPKKIADGRSVIQFR